MNKKDLQKFEDVHVIHDYILYDDNYNIFATISATKKEMKKIVNQVYNNRKSLYAFLQKELPKKITAHQTYTNKEYVFNMDGKK